MKPKGILVDFDGTLVDSIQPLYNVYLAFLSKYGCQGSTKEFHELNGPKLAKIVQILGQRYKLPGSQEELIEIYRQQLYDFYASQAKPFDDAVEILKEWKREGIKLALVTSAHPDLVNCFLRFNEMENVFDCLVTSEEVNQGKPDPSIYMLALKKLGINPREAIVLEDSPNGLISAVRAGLFTIVLRPLIEEPQWRGVWAEVKNWKQIKSWIEKYNE